MSKRIAILPRKWEAVYGDQLYEYPRPTNTPLEFPGFTVKWEILLLSEVDVDQFKMALKVSHNFFEVVAWYMLMDN